MGICPGRAAILVMETGRLKAELRTIKFKGKRYVVPALAGLEDQSEAVMEIVARR